MRWIVTKIVIGVLFCAASALAQLPGDTIWTKTYGGIGSDLAREIQPTSDGGFIVVGDYEMVEDGTNGIYLLRLNSSGDTLWTRVHCYGPYSIGRSVMETSEGGFVLGGYSNQPEENGHFYLMKTDSNGDTLWTHRYGGDSYSEAECIRPTDDGGFILVGTIDSITAGGVVGYAVKTDSAGNSEWEQTYYIGNLNTFHSVEQTTDGGYIMLGGGGFWGNHDIWLVKTDAGGDTLWTAYFSAGDDDYGFGFQQTNDGGYIIAGSTWSTTTVNWDVILVKTDSLGIQQWLKRSGQSSNEQAMSIKLTDDGGFIIAGSTDYGRDGYTDMWLIRADSSGNIIWTATYGGAGNEVANSVNITATGDFILAGSRDSDTTWADVYVVYARDGEVSSCLYKLGDINGDGLRGGGDVTYGVRFFKLIGNRPPDSCYMDSTGTWLYVAGDVNGNCEFRGSDITRLVAYFKLIAPLQYCHFFPTWPMRGIPKTPAIKD
jgi:hypothetical protein